MTTYRKGELLNRMLVLATTSHADQYDKGGHPYILHPLAVMQMLNSDDEELLCIALGHDLVEDCDNITYQYLRDKGMTERIIDGIRCLTKVPGETYEEYKTKVKSNPDSIKVKMCDLRHNTDIRRLRGVSDKDIKRMERYFHFYLELANIEKAKAQPPEHPMNEYEIKAEIAKKVCEIIDDHFGLNAPVATDLEVSVMKDLGADSLDVVELAMEFELTFNLQYNDYSSESLEDVIGEGTIDDIVNHIYIVTRDAVTTTEAVTPELKIPMEVTVVSFRNEIMERIRKHVAFYETFHTSRFKPAQDFLIEKRSPSTLLSSKQRRKIQIELDEMAYLDDIELLDFYEIIIRCWSKQM